MSLEGKPKEWTTQKGKAVTMAPTTNTPAVLRAEALSLGYADRRIVNELSMELPAGKVTIIVGANACGKSTLLCGLARLLKPAGGCVTLGGRDIHRLPSRQVARSLGVLPQTQTAPEGITVAELVGRGRTPHQGWFRQWTAADDGAVASALEGTDTSELAERAVDELSGGQRQRVWIAMAMAQQTDILLLDEPTTYLDLAHQVEVLELVAELNSCQGTTVAIVLHDLNLAARYGDHMIAMKQGRIVASGVPSEVVTAESVREVFGMASVIVPGPVAGSPMVVPMGRQPQTLDTRHRTPGRSRRCRHERRPQIQPAGRSAPSRCLCAGSAGYRSWLAMDPAARCHMRTYTVREFRPTGHGSCLAELDVDFVLHLDGGSGPAAAWATPPAPARSRPHRPRCSRGTMPRDRIQARRFHGRAGAPAAAGRR